MVFSLSIDTSSSSVGLAAGAAVAGVAVLIILTVAVVVLVVCLRRYSLYTPASIASLFKASTKLYVCIPTYMQAATEIQVL